MTSKTKTPAASKGGKRANGGGVDKTLIPGSEIAANVEANRAQRHEHLPSDEDLGDGSGERVFIEDGRDRVYTSQSKERWGSNPDELIDMRAEQKEVADKDA